MTLVTKSVVKSETAIADYVENGCCIHLFKIFPQTDPMVFILSNGIVVNVHLMVFGMLVLLLKCYSKCHA